MPDNGESLGGFRVLLGGIAGEAMSVRKISKPINLFF